MQQIMILSGESKYNYDIYAGQAAVFIHLHYRDTLDKYFTYINRIPKSIPIYISSSDKWVEDKVNKYAVEQKRNITVCHKENRGRDITSLLVTYREIMLQYEYVCFLHDKKEKREREKKDITLWIDNLWGNMLGEKGTGYFFDILATFDRDKSLGLLVPPEPIGEFFAPYNSWIEPNVFQTRKLAEELKVCVDIDSDIENQPIALGTCFWARTCAIKKILVKEWNYEDFDDEPLPENAKSYAVERIFGYLAEDAGYHSCTVMNNTYATVYMNFLIECRRKSFPIIKDRYEVCNLFGIKRLKELIDYVSVHKVIYIYGAGKIGMGVYRYLTDMGYVPRNFLVSQKDQDYNNMPIPVLGIEQLIYENGMGIIVAVSRQATQTIVNALEKMGINNYFCMRE
ncbi:MAG: rhamnan synthesis F family protein [Clostridiales bacterium]|nr:rhamnan synthesis F family protein [Clostridiales bacterium]